jgi:hypothetical protein
MRRVERTVADEVKGTEMNQAMPDASRTIERVRAVLRQESIGVTVVVPSYGEGSGIVPTLASLWDGMVQLGLQHASILLSDSSPDHATVDAARE